MVLPLLPPSREKGCWPELQPRPGQRRLLFRVLKYISPQPLSLTRTPPALLFSPSPRGEPSQYQTYTGSQNIIYFNIEHPIHSTCHPTLSTRALSTKSTNPSSSSCKISKALAVISAKVGSLVVWSSKSNLIHQSVNQHWLCSRQPVAQLIVGKEAKEIFSVRCIYSR